MGFGERLEQGRDFEIKVAIWIRRAGWHVVPLYMLGGIDRDTPRALGTDANHLVLPDMLAIKGGKSVWVEAKIKNRMRAHPATGFHRRLYEDYLQVQQTSGNPVVLIFQDGVDLYGGKLDAAAQHIYRADMPIQGEPHVLFKVPEAFQAFRWRTRFDELLREGST